MFNIAEFSASFGQKGFAKKSHFDVLCTPPVGLQGADDILMRANAVDFPGRRVLSSDFLTYGPIQKVAYGSIFQDLSMQVILSPDMAEKLFLQRWQDAAAGFARGTEQYIAGLFDIGYYAEYTGQISIIQYDDHGEITYECRMWEAWPNAVLPLRGDWNDDDPHLLLVTFAYRYFTDDDGFYEAQLEEETEETEGN